MSIFTSSESTLQVTILVLPESSMLVLASMIDPMRAANRLSESQCFAWKIVTTDGLPVECTCGLQITPDGKLESVKDGNLLFIVSGFKQFEYISSDEIRLIRRFSSKFEAIGGVDTGAWILGKAGLIDGKSVTTHWEDLEDFEDYFRNTNVQPDRFVIDKDVVTIGGASPTFDFMLHLIRSRLGYPMALEVASVFVYDETHFSTDAQPLVSLGLLNDFEPRVTKAIRIMESQLDEPITVTDVATQIAVTSAEGYVGDAVTVTIQTLDANAKAASTAAGVTVTVATDSGTLSAASVTLQPNETSTTVTLTSSAVGSASITASATGLTSGSGTVTANNTVSSLVVSGSPVNAGSTVTVTAIGKPAASATFSISGDVATAVAMTEEAGTYTGSYTATSAVVDGSYDGTVTIGAGSDSSAGSVVVDNTAPAITSASSDKTSLRNGESLTLTVVADAGATVSADVSALDTTQAAAVAVAESTETAGTYSADVTVSSDTAAESGDKVIVVTATDAAGNSSTSNVTVSLTTFSAFDLVVPKGIGLVHVPLSVTEVNGEKKALATIGDLYDAIGDDKAFLITYDTEAGSWRSYLGANNKGSASDVDITDDLGIITVRTAATDSVTVSLKGNALGNGASSITLKKGKNLVGVPVKDSRIATVGELLSLEGVSATSAIVSDQGAFKVLTALDKGEDSDIAITGGQSFIIIGKDDATVAVSGDAWDNASAVATAPAMSAIGFEVLNQTPVLAIEGSLNSNGLPIETDQFKVSLKNVTTGAIHSGTISDSQFKLTVVDAVSAKVASVGDVLEVSVETGNKQYGVESQRHTVSQTDVSTSLLRLPELVTYEIPAETALLANYPNPFNPETWVPFRLAADSNVQLTIYDASGSMVRQIDIGFKSAAVYESRDRAIYWNGRNASGEIVASGVYFYTLEAGDYVSTRKMLILK